MSPLLKRLGRRAVCTGPTEPDTLSTKSVQGKHAGERLRRGLLVSRRCGQISALTVSRISTHEVSTCYSLAINPRAYSSQQPMRVSASGVMPFAVQDDGVEGGMGQLARLDCARRRCRRHFAERARSGVGPPRSELCSSISYSHRDSHLCSALRCTSRSLSISGTDGRLEPSG